MCPSSKLWGGYGGSVFLNFSTFSGIMGIKHLDVFMKALEILNVFPVILNLLSVLK